MHNGIANRNRKPMSTIKKISYISKKTSIHLQFKICSTTRVIYYITIITTTECTTITTPIII